MREVELKALRFIARYIEENQRPPTYRDIAHALRFRSSSTANDIVYALGAHGYVSFEPRRTRTLQVTQRGREAIAEAEPVSD
ncbi:MAG: hypothetical protein IKF14_13805 [Atopobiaceae bacterium]|nr:hypothetical protein [Atopobiaceae bacterium]